MFDSVWDSDTRCLSWKLTVQKKKLWNNLFAFNCFFCIKAVKGCQRFMAVSKMSLWYTYTQWYTFLLHQQRHQDKTLTDLWYFSDNSVRVILPVSLRWCKCVWKPGFVSNREHAHSVTHKVAIACKHAWKRAEVTVTYSCWEDFLAAIYQKIQLCELFFFNLFINRSLYKYHSLLMEIRNVWVSDDITWFCGKLSFTFLPTI